MEEQFDSFLEDLSDTSTRDLDLFALPLTLALEPLADLPFFTEPDAVCSAVLCAICRRNIVKTTDSTPVAKKRKLTPGPLYSSRTVCEECYSLPSEGLADAPDKAKRAVKRRHAKERVLESEAVRKLKEEQDELLKDKESMTEAQIRKIQQQMRNRISAQQSRDRKKRHLIDLQHRNQGVERENEALRHRLRLLETENKHLKNQLTSIHLGEDTGLSLNGVAKMGALALAVVVSMVVLLNSVQTDDTAGPRKLAEEIRLDEYVNPKGISIQETAQKLLNELSLPVESFTPTANFEEHILRIREKRTDAVGVTSSLRALAGPTDPCARGMSSDIRARGLTTFYCPTVKAYWGDHTRELKYLQVLLPAASIQGEDIPHNYLMELMCRVSEVNILPIGEQSS